MSPRTMIALFTAASIAAAFGVTAMRMRTKPDPCSARGNFDHPACAGRWQKSSSEVRDLSEHIVLAAAERSVEGRR